MLQAWITWLLIKKEKMIFAILWAIVFLCAFWLKGTHVFFGPLFLIGLLTLKGQKALKSLVTISGIVFLGLSLHGAFSYSKIGQFLVSSSAGGLNFIEGKCPMKNNADSAGYSWLSPLYHQLGFSAQKKWDQPFTNSSYFMKEGLKCIAQDPSVMIRSIEGIPFLFVGNTLWPANQFQTSAWMRLYELFFAFFIMSGTLIFFRSLLEPNHFRLDEFVVWGLPILSLFLCVYIFKSEIRFRIPFDVWFIPVSFRGWHLLVRAKFSEHPRPSTIQNWHQ
jgi:hypothetical protein